MKLQFSVAFVFVVVAPVCVVSAKRTGPSSRDKGAHGERSGRQGPRMFGVGNIQKLCPEALWVDARMHAMKDERDNTIAIKCLRTQPQSEKKVFGEQWTSECRPDLCLREGAKCIPGKLYIEGCEPSATAGGNQCGEQCPKGVCEAERCEEGFTYDDYLSRKRGVRLNCLKTGINKVGDKKYKWAITSGHVIAGGNEKQNTDFGEYVVTAYRQPISRGSISHDDGLISYIFPCQFVQLVECGCGKRDMHTFGVLGYHDDDMTQEIKPPNPCRNYADCHVLCNDADEEFSEKICENIPLEFFEDEHEMFGMSFFLPNTSGIVHITTPNDNEYEDD